MTWIELNRRYLVTAQFDKGAKSKCIRLTEGELRKSFEITFQAYGELLESVTLFKYLGRVLMAGDDDWPSVAGNLRKARKICTRMTRILGW